MTAYPAAFRSAWRGAWPAAWRGDPDAPARVDLVRSRALHPQVVVSRASTGASFSAAGALSFPAANMPRWSQAGRLIVEGARTNSIRNPRGEGAAAPGDTPTNWSAPANMGLAREYLGVGLEDGWPYIDFRFSGTPTGSGNVRIALEALTGVPTVNGDTWAMSAAFRLLAGTLDNVTSVRLCVVQRASNTSVLSTLNGQDAVVGATRTPYSALLTINNASAAFAAPEMMFTVAQGAAVNMTLRLYAPRQEKANFASTPIYPDPGVLAATTRAADFATYALPATAQARGTLSGIFAFYGLPPSGLSAGLLALNNGTDNERQTLQIAPAGQVTGSRVSTAGGTSNATATMMTAAPGTPFKAALAWDETGVSFAAGGQSTTLAGKPLFDRLMIGQERANGSRPLFGEIGDLFMLPTRLSDTDLRALTA